MPTPLAEALVKIKLVVDQGGTEKEVNKIANSFKTEINKEIRALNIVGSRLHHAADTILKSIVLPASALGTAGVYKYMQTTEKGAAQLRLALGSLRYSWDQFLARIGRVINNSEILTKVIGKLKNLLDTLDDKKIGKLIDKAVWAFALFAIIKMAAGMVSMAKSALILKKEMLELRAYDVGGVIANLGRPISRRFRDIMETLPRDMPSMEKRTIARKMLAQSGPAALKAREAAIKNATLAQTLGPTIGSLGANIVGQVTGMATAFVKFIPKLVKFGMIITLWAAMIEAVFRGLGLTSKDLANAFSSLAKGVGVALDWVTYIFTTFVGVLEIGVASIVEVIKWMATIFGGEGGSITRLNDHMQEVFKRMADARPWEKKDGEKAKDMRFLGQGTSTTSFAGLNAAMQSMITLENEMKSRRENTDAIKENTAALKEKVYQGGLNDYMTKNPGTMINGPFMDKNAILAY